MKGEATVLGFGGRAPALVSHVCIMSIDQQFFGIIVADQQEIPGSIVDC